MGFINPQSTLVKHDQIIAYHSPAEGIPAVGQTLACCLAAEDSVSAHLPRGKRLQFTKRSGKPMVSVGKRSTNSGFSTSMFVYPRVS